MGNFNLTKSPGPKNRGNGVVWGGATHLGQFFIGSSSCIKLTLASMELSLPSWICPHKCGPLCPRIGLWVPTGSPGLPGPLLGAEHPHPSSFCPDPSSQTGESAHVFLQMWNLRLTTIPQGRSTQEEQESLHLEPYETAFWYSNLWSRICNLSEPVVHSEPLPARPLPSCACVVQGCGWRLLQMMPLL